MTWTGRNESGQSCDQNFYHLATAALRSHAFHPPPYLQIGSDPWMEKKKFNAALGMILIPFTGNWNATELASNVGGTEQSKKKCLVDIIVLVSLSYPEANS